MHPVITEYLMDAHSADLRTEAAEFRRSQAAARPGTLRLALRRITGSRTRKGATRRVATGEHRVTSAEYLQVAGHSQ